MKHIKELTTIGFGDIIGSGISAIFWFYLATLIIPEKYGELNYFISIASIASYVALIGTQNTITVYVAKKIPIESTFNFISLIGGIIGFLVLYVIFERLDIGFLILGYIINNLTIGLILGRNEYNRYLKYLLLQKILTPILGLSFFFTLGYDWIIYGLAISYAGFTLIIYKSFRDTKINFSLLTNRKGFIMNNYFNALSGTFHGHVDKIIIMPILGAALLGNYSLALQIVSSMMIFSSIFFKYMLPKEASGENIIKVKKMLIFSSIVFTLIGYFLVPIVLHVYFPKFEGAIEAIKIMSLAIVPLSIVKIYTSKFLAMEKSKFILIGLIVSLSILISTMIMFGILYDIIGIAISFVLASIAQSLYFYFVGRKLGDKKYEKY